MIFRISIAQAHRNRYGLAYPCTYEFQLPAASSGLEVHRRYPGGLWHVLPTRVASASYAGQQGVRWDYAANRAWVSAAFDHQSSAPSFDLRFWKDGAEVTSGIAYIGVPKYFDNRPYGVCVTWDDWDHEYHPYFMAATIACQQRGIWCSPAVVPGGIQPIGHTALTTQDWADMQGLVSAGYVDIAGHSMYHWNVDQAYNTEADAIVHVDQCAAALVANLTLPVTNRMGAQQFVGGFVSPYGSWNTATRARKQHAGFVAERSFEVPPVSGNVWRAYSGTLNTFERHIHMLELDEDGAFHWNNQFDAYAAAGGIYHAVGHPWGWKQPFDFASPSSDINTHLDYIAGHDDAWYVGFGHQYMYRLVALEASVASMADDAPGTPIGGGDTPAVTLEHRYEIRPAGASVWELLQDWTENTEIAETPGYPAGATGLRAKSRNAATLTESEWTEIEVQRLAVSADIAFAGTVPLQTLAASVAHTAPPVVQFATAVPVQSLSASVTVEPPVYATTFAASVPVQSLAATVAAEVPEFAATFAASVPLQTLTAEVTALPPAAGLAFYGTVPVQTLSASLAVPTFSASYAATVPLQTLAASIASTQPAGVVFSASVPTQALSASLSHDAPAYTATFAGAVPVQQLSASMGVDAPAYAATFAGSVPLQSLSATVTAAPPAAGLAFFGAVPVQSLSATVTRTVPAWDATFAGAVPLQTLNAGLTHTAPSSGVAYAATVPMQTLDAALAYTVPLYELAFAGVVPMQYSIPPYPLQVLEMEAALVRRVERTAALTRRIELVTTV